MQDTECHYPLGQQKLLCKCLKPYLALDNAGKQMCNIFTLPFNCNNHKFKFIEEKTSLTKCVKQISFTISTMEPRWSIYLEKPHQPIHLKKPQFMVSYTLQIYIYQRKEKRHLKKL
ncbi:hypothetical protein ACJW30_01G044400 [Castanea mollissima]